MIDRPRASRNIAVTGKCRHRGPGPAVTPDRPLAILNQHPLEVLGTGRAIVDVRRQMKRSIRQLTEGIDIGRRAHLNADRQQRFRRGSHLVFQRHAFVFEGS
jgi:hypothetical protein